MTSLKLTTVLAASFLVIASGVANAADTPFTTPQGWGAPAKTVDMNKKVAAAATKPRSEASIECSKQADAKGLHGKERKSFRATCKANYKTGKSTPDKT